MAFWEPLSIWLGREVWLMGEFGITTLDMKFVGYMIEAWVGDLAKHPEMRQSMQDNQPQ
jgi:hypothetical protein